MCNSPNAMINQRMKSPKSLSPVMDKVKWGFCSEVVNKSGLGNLSKTAVGGFAANFNKDFLLPPHGLV